MGTLFASRERNDRLVLKRTRRIWALSHMHEKTLPTEEALKHEYDALVALCQSDATRETDLPPKNDRVPPLVNLEEETQEKKFMIQIGSSDLNDEIEEVEWEAEYEEHDSVGGKIEVIHKHKLPNLQGILKQRSVSESSADDNSKVSRENSSDSPDSASPRGQESDDSAGRLRRSVSFNERIDMTTFRTNATVTSMTATLKGKRRRQRKRDRRHDTTRQRYYSTGSECSSDDYEHRGAGAGSEHTDVDDAFVRPAPPLATTKVQKTATKLPQVDLVEEKNKVNRDKDSGASNSSGSGSGSSSGSGCNSSEANPSRDSDELSEPENESESKSENAVTRADTILSWEEKPNTEPEHRTQCAFQFSNSVMFDLDVE